MRPTYWDTICIPHMFFTLENLGYYNYIGSAISIPTYVSSNTLGVKPPTSVIPAPLNTILKSSAKSGFYSNISTQSCGLGFDP